jgi:hypothetical protein
LEAAVRITRGLARPLLSAHEALPEQQLDRPQLVSRAKQRDRAQRVHSTLRLPGAGADLREPRQRELHRVISRRLRDVRLEPAQRDNHCA